MWNQAHVRRMSVVAAVCATAAWLALGAPPAAAATGGGAGTGTTTYDHASPPQETNCTVTVPVIGTIPDPNAPLAYNITAVHSGSGHGVYRVNNLVYEGPITYSSSVSGITHGPNGTFRPFSGPGDCSASKTSVGHTYSGATGSVSGSFTLGGVARSVTCTYNDPTGTYSRRETVETLTLRGNCTVTVGGTASPSSPTIETRLYESGAGPGGFYPTPPAPGTCTQYAPGSPDGAGIAQCWTADELVAR